MARWGPGRIHAPGVIRGLPCEKNTAGCEQKLEQRCDMTTKKNYKDWSETDLSLLPIASVCLHGLRLILTCSQGARSRRKRGIMGSPGVLSDDVN